MSTMPTKPLVLQTKKLDQPPEGFDDTSRGDVHWHTLFSSPETPTDQLTAGLGICPVGTGRLCKHRHKHAEIYYITEGIGEVTVDAETYEVSNGHTIYIPGDAEHGIKNVGNIPLKWFYVFAADSFSEIVYRFSHEQSSE
ncbi:hypothetical protein OGAPHI_002047 [Ogataea philodendri]|uniref:Cupin type-2 domain-containing protein n=1 Tax=Ogataea philodendri TaxID=1378263 RepID=A0A9P8P9X7_9ASCO|nr:uncharacterized protein OGAPHI_002047 [Ogataea philodendri]KAH3668293.1 hypothetical protein OGAPHI_002047 [Ogataea philodendri]